ncbi:MAG: putative ABC transporter permease subunit [Gemmatimonadales bacterium]
MRFSIADPGDGSARFGAILIPKWQSLKNRLRRTQTGSSARLLLLLLLGGAFWLAVFGVSFRVLRYFKGVEEIGPLLAGKLLAVGLLAFAAILLLSNLVTALSTFFLAKDLDTLVAAPVDWIWFYLAKLGETLAHSSWMVVLMMVPILTAYGIVFDGGPWFPLVAAGILLPYFVLPTVVGSVITLILVNVFPARRARDLLSLVALAAIGGLVLFLRLAQPEQLARPEGFRNLLEFIATLRAPSHPLLPSEWASSALMNWLLRVRDPLPPLLLWSTAGAFIVIGASFHRRLFPPGFTKSQEGTNRATAGSLWSRLLGAALRWLPVTRREFILKDLRIFFRDATQWSQLILLAVLLIVYVYNIRALPLYTGERVPYMVVTLVVFLNQGLAGFVLSAIAARFIFPSVSLEGRQLWLLRSSPLDLRAMLWSKYWVGTLPLLILALGIGVITNRILQAPPFMMVLATLTTVSYTLAVGALALALGVFFPQFETENAAQIPTSFGGLVFMLAAVILLTVIIVIEAVPVAEQLRAWQVGELAGTPASLLVALGLVLVTCAVATVVPLQFALRRLSALEA